MTRRKAPAYERPQSARRVKFNSGNAAISAGSGDANLASTGGAAGSQRHWPIAGLSGTTRSSCTRPPHQRGEAVGIAHRNLLRRSPVAGAYLSLGQPTGCLGLRIHRFSSSIFALAYLIDATPSRHWNSMPRFRITESRARTYSCGYAMAMSASGLLAAQRQGNSATRDSLLIPRAQFSASQRTTGENHLVGADDLETALVSVVIYVSSSAGHPISP